MQELIVNNENYTLREAQLSDAAQIIHIYHSIYDGSYPDRNFSDYLAMKASMDSNDKKIFVASVGDKVVASILFYYDRDNKIAKASSAVVAAPHRGNNLTKKLLKYGIDYLEQSFSGLELVYVTTRTVHRAAQILTQGMGFKPFGIFPNVHRTNVFETHALAGLYLNDALSKRYTSFKHHELIYNFYKIAASQVNLPEMEVENNFTEKIYNGDVGKLEIIEAEEFIKHRFELQTKQNSIDFAFFPFALPNVLITNPEQTIEVYAHINEVDKHCVILGCKADRVVSFSKLLRKVTWMLRDRGVRYVEMIARANRANIIDKIIKAKFIPSGYLPALQEEDGVRYDYVIFSRSFETLDFEDLQLTGVNSLYLSEYINIWQQTYLSSKKDLPELLH